MDKLELGPDWWLLQLETATVEIARAERQIRISTPTFEEAIYELSISPGWDSSRIAKVAGKTPRQINTIRDRVAALKHREALTEFSRKLDSPEREATWKAAVLEARSTRELNPTAEAHADFQAALRAAESADTAEESRELREAAKRDFEEALRLIASG